MNILILIIGILAFAMGILWSAQGLGYINWPASSFMIGKVEWSYYGGGLALVGLIIIWFSRR